MYFVKKEVVQELEPGLILANIDKLIKEGKATPVPTYKSTLGMLIIQRMINSGEWLQLTCDTEAAMSEIEIRKFFNDDTPAETLKFISTAEEN